MWISSVYRIAAKLNDLSISSWWFRYARLNTFVPYYSPIHISHPQMSIHWILVSSLPHTSNQINIHTNTLYTHPSNSIIFNWYSIMKNVHNKHSLTHSHSTETEDTTKTKRRGQREAAASQIRLKDTHKLPPKKHVFHSFNKKKKNNNSLESISGCVHVCNGGARERAHCIANLKYVAASPD